MKMNFNVSLKELVDTQDELIHSLKFWLTDKERKFILSVKKAKPDQSMHDNITKRFKIVDGLIDNKQFMV